jgi:transcriptional regulator of met regulon
MHERSLQVRKSSLSDRQMSGAVYTDQAIQWSRELTRMRSRGHGDTDNAMRDVASVYKLDYSTLWRMRYRRDQIKDIGVTIYMRLLNAYRTERARQAQLNAQEERIAAKLAESLFAAEDEGLAMVAHDDISAELQPDVSEVAAGHTLSELGAGAANPESAAGVLADRALLNGGAQ